MKDYLSFTYFVITISIIPIFGYAQLNPSIRPVSATDTVEAGQAYWVEVEVGNPEAVTDLYGLSLKLTTDDVNTSYVSGSGESGVFLGTDVLEFTEGVDAQTVDMAVTKKSGAGASGSGIVMRAQFTSSVSGPVSFSLEDISATNAQGDDILLEASMLEVEVVEEADPPPPPPEDAASIRPVSATDTVEAGQAYWVEVEVGNPEAVTDLYGLSLKLTTDDVNTSYVSGSGESGVFLGTDVLEFTEGVDAQTVDMAVTKKSGAGASGSGIVMRAQFTSSVSGPVSFSLEDISATNAQGDDILLEASMLEVEVVEEADPPPPPPEDAASIRPVSATDTVEAGQAYWVEVEVGNPEAVTDLYGLSLKLTTDDVNTSYVSGSGESGVFLGTDVLEFTEGVDAQTVDMAVTKKSGAGASGSGIVMRAQFTSSVSGPVSFSLEDISATNAQGDDILLEASMLEVEVVEEADPPPPPPEDAASIRPVSATDTVEAGQAYWVEVEVGNPEAVTDLYGLSLKLTTDDVNTSYVSGSGESGVFLGTDVLEFTEGVDAQTVDMAVTKKSGAGASGSGIVMRAQFTSSVSGPVSFSLEDISATNAQGDDILLEASMLEVEVVEEADPPPPPPEDAASIRPVSATDTVEAGQAYWVEVEVGNPEAVTDLYGLSLKLTTDDVNTSYVSGSGESGVFLGTDVLEFTEGVDAQTVDMAVTKKSGAGASGSGIVMRAQFTSSVSGPVSFSLEDISATNAQGDDILLEASMLEVEVVEEADPPPPPPEDAASIRPVSATDTVEAGQAYWVEVEVGNPEAVTDLYGLSLKLTTDDVNTSYVSGSGESGVFLGTDVLEFTEGVDAQTVDMAVTKKSGAGASGSGIVMRAQFTSSVSGPVSFSLEDISATNAQGDDILLEASMLEVEVVEVGNENLSPFIQNPIGKIELDEDFGEVFVAKLDTVFTDPESKPLTFEIIEYSSVIFEAELSNNYLILTSQPDQNGEGFVIVKATDEEGIEVRDTLIVTVNSVNQPPSFITVLSDTTIHENQTLEFTFIAEDSDGDELTFSLAESSEAGSINHETGEFSLEADFELAGKYTITVEVSDGKLTSYTSSNLVVVNVNRPPEFTSALPDTTINVGGLLEFIFEAEDADGDTLDFSLKDGPEGASIDSKTGSLSWKIVDGEVGNYTITVNVSDGIDTVSTSADIIVNDVVSTEIKQIPESFTLNQNYPNPFNPTSTIRYGIPEATEVKLEVFNMLGQSVAVPVDGKKSAGWHTATIDASNFSSGVYIYRIVAGDFVDTKQMTLIK